MKCPQINYRPPLVFALGTAVGAAIIKSFRPHSWVVSTAAAAPFGFAAALAEVVRTGLCHMRPGIAPDLKRPLESKKSPTQGPAECQNANPASGVPTETNSLRKINGQGAFSAGEAEYAPGSCEGNADPFNVIVRQDALSGLGEELGPGASGARGDPFGGIEGQGAFSALGEEESRDGKVEAKIMNGTMPMASTVGLEGSQPFGLETQGPKREGLDADLTDSARVDASLSLTLPAVDLATPSKWENVSIYGRKTVGDVRKAIIGAAERPKELQVPMPVISDPTAVSWIDRQEPASEQRYLLQCEDLLRQAEAIAKLKLEAKAIPIQQAFQFWCGLGLLSLYRNRQIAGEFGRPIKVSTINLCRCNARVLDYDAMRVMSINGQLVTLLEIKELVFPL